MDASPTEILMDLATQITPQQTTAVLLKNDQVFEAALQALRQNDFNPCHTLSVSFPRSKQSQQVVNQRRFLSLLLQNLQNSSVFEGPEGAKNLALNSQGRMFSLNEDIINILSSYLCECSVSCFRGHIIYSYVQNY